MPRVIHQPQDKLFKLSMGNLRVAKEFLQAHLPVSLLKQMDLQTLKLEKESFVDEAYKANEADIVYNIKLNRKTTYIYILCEQQSIVDPNMAFRLWVYMVRLMERHIRQYTGSPLPFVYPLVVYSGKKSWNAPREIFHLFGSEEALAREWLFKPYQLIDIHRISDEVLRQRNWCGLMEFALKYRRVGDFAGFLETILPWIRRLEDCHEAEGHFIGKIVLQYVLDDINANDINLFLQKINHHMTGDLRGEIMTLAQQFKKQGIQQGIRQGGAALILHQIQRRFGTLSPMYARRIADADTQTLLVWSEKILDAEHLEDVFIEE